MLGAIIGDIVGSVYEYENHKSTEFEFFDEECEFTDDTVLTVAVADWLLSDKACAEVELQKKLVDYAKNYIESGYGLHFLMWILHPKKEVGEDGSPIEVRRPYDSYGNGSAMRCSAVGWMFDTLEETERVAAISASVTHNHPEGVKGAQATAAAIFMARSGSSKEEIRSYIESKYGYGLNCTCDEIRPIYEYDVTCQGTVPEAIIAFLESTDYESAIRLGVSLGGDTDTLCCITGGIAEAYYKHIPKEMAEKALSYLPEGFVRVLQKMKEETVYGKIVG